MPHWVDDAIVYAVVPDRFARGDDLAPGADASAFVPWSARPVAHSLLGGTLGGVTDRLDHLVDLGVTVLYLLPVWPSPSYHRYKPTAWDTVDPLLGGDAAFDRLVAAAHDRGLRVVLDAVFNHVSWAHPAFASVVENGDRSPWRAWFRIESFPVEPWATSRAAGYAAWAGRRDMPQLDHGNPAVRSAIVDAVVRWARRGVDGFRFDCPGELGDDEFWRGLRRDVRAVNPDVYLVGEEWIDATRWLQGDQWDGTTDYPMMGVIRRFAGGDHTDDRHVLPGSRGERPLDGAGFLREVGRLLLRYPEPQQRASWVFANSTDVARFTTVTGSPERAWLATVLATTLPGTPCIVYGDEVGLVGGLDPDNRRGFPPAGEWDTGLLAQHRDLFALRRGSPALRRGRLHPLGSTGPACAFERAAGDERVVVIANAGDTDRGIEREMLGPGPLWDAVTGDRIDDAHRLTAGPASARLLTSRPPAERRPAQDAAGGVTLGPHGTT